MMQTPCATLDTLHHSAPPPPPPPSPSPSTLTPALPHTVSSPHHSGQQLLHQSPPCGTTRQQRPRGRPLWGPTDPNQSPLIEIPERQSHIRVPPNYAVAPAASSAPLWPPPACGPTNPTPKSVAPHCGHLQPAAPPNPLPSQWRPKCGHLLPAAPPTPNCTPR